MRKSRLCDILRIKYPIIQAPMLWLSWAELVAAVSQSGGLGTIGANSGAREPTKDINLLGERLRQQIQQVRSLTDRPFAVNVMGQDAYSERFAQVVIQEQVPVAVVSGEDAGIYTERFHKVGIKVIHRLLNCTVPKAIEAENEGIDALIAVGYDAGGHVSLDKVPNLVLIPQIVDSVKIPVIAGGGIGDARGFVAAFALGAEGIYMGTRFIATKECPAHPNMKQALIDTDATSITTIDFPFSVLKCMKNPLTERAFSMLAQGIPAEQVEREVFGGKARIAFLEGDLVNGSPIFGQVAGLIHEVVSAGELVKSLVEGYDKVVANL